MNGSDRSTGWSFRLVVNKQDEVLPGAGGADIRLVLVYRQDSAPDGVSESLTIGVVGNAT